MTSVKKNVVLRRIDKEMAKRKLKSLNISSNFEVNFCSFWLAKCLVNMFDFICLWLRKSSRPKEVAK